jgi:hypothetical protein
VSLARDGDELTSRLDGLGDLLGHILQVLLFVRDKSEVIMKISRDYYFSPSSEAPGVIRASAAAYLGLAWRAMLPR